MYLLFMNRKTTSNNGGFGARVRVFLKSLPYHMKKADMGYPTPLFLSYDMTTNRKCGYDAKSSPEDWLIVAEAAKMGEIV
jgi:hypothetical protein